MVQFVALPFPFSSELTVWPFQNAVVQEWQRNLPIYLLDDFHSSEQIHNYDTRNKDLIRLPLARTTKFQTSFKYNAAKSWNTLPRNLRHDQSLASFKLKVKKFLNRFS